MTVWDDKKKKERKLMKLQLLINVFEFLHIQQPN